VADKYYGVYLIPPPDLVYAISVAHGVLEREFNTRTASAFMAHCTVKGFTKLRDGVSGEDLIPALDVVFSGARPFKTEIHAPWVSSGGSRGESVLLWMSKNEAFQELHNNVWQAIEPHIASDCLFTPAELHGEDFPPHITLVQSDLSSEPEILAQGKALCDYIYDRLPRKEFEARDFQLIEFESEDWAGAWWETLRSRQIKGWSLG